MKSLLIIAVLSFFCVCFYAIEMDDLNVFFESEVFLSGPTPLSTNEDIVAFSYTKLAEDGNFYSIMLAWSDRESSYFDLLEIAQVDFINAHKGSVLGLLENGEMIVFYIDREPGNVDIAGSSRLNYVQVSPETGIMTSGILLENVHDLPYVFVDGNFLSLAFKDGMSEYLHHYQYFTELEMPYYGNYPGEIRFFGGDQLYGPVHSNWNIYIRLTGGGWPTFHGPVTTSGEVYVYPGNHQNYPETEVFGRGLQENVQERIITYDTQENAIVLAQVEHIF